MPSLIDMRRRIRSVRNTQQITKAMKMISAARLRKAQERAFNTRPYSGLLKEVLESLAARSEGVTHPLLARRDIKHLTAIIVTGDRGLCGAFNTNIIRAAERFMREKGAVQMELIAVGRKSRDYFKRRTVNIARDYAGIFTKLNFAHGKQIAADVIESYAEEKTDAVYLIYNEFKSVISQKLTIEQLLPLEPFHPAPGAALIDYIYEQPPAEMFASLLPRYVEIQIFRALLESAAAEHAARMTAMDSATNNAGDMIEGLTLNMNRIRQAAITKELIEVVSGAAAL